MGNIITFYNASASSVQHFMDIVTAREFLRWEIINFRYYLSPFVQRLIHTSVEDTIKINDIDCTLLFVLKEHGSSHIHEWTHTIPGNLNRTKLIRYGSNVICEREHYTLCCNPNAHRTTFLEKKKKEICIWSLLNTSP